MIDTDIREWLDPSPAERARSLGPSAAINRFSRGGKDSV